MIATDFIQFRGKLNQVAILSRTLAIRAKEMGIESRKTTAIVFPPKRNRLEAAHSFAAAKMPAHCRPATARLYAPVSERRHKSIPPTFHAKSGPAASRAIWPFHCAAGLIRLPSI
jgi:hypothetical protein